MSSAMMRRYERLPVSGDDETSRGWPLSSTLVVLAIALLGCILFFDFAVHLTPGRLTRPSASLIELLPMWLLTASVAPPFLQDERVVATLLLTVTGGAFLAYGLALFVCWNRRPEVTTVAIVMTASGLFLATGVLALPNANTDIFNYVARGRIAAEYGANPYYVAVDAFPQDPIYPYASHRFTAEPGGKLPTWMMLNVVLARLAGDDVITNLLVYRAALFLFCLGSLGVLAAVLQRLCPRHLLAGLVLYGWNPVVAVYGTAKTDTLIIFFLLLAGLFFLAGRRAGAAISLGLSVFVKLMTLPLAAVYVGRAIVSRRWREAGVTVGLFTLVTVAVYLPFWQDSGVLMDHANLLQAGGSSAPGFLQPLWRLAFLAVLGWACVTRDDTYHSLFRAWAVVMVCFSLFVTDFSLPWYQMLPLAAVALTGDWRLTVGVVALSFSSFLLNLWHATSTLTFPLPDLVSMPRYALYLMPLCGIASVVAGWTLWRNRRFPSKAAILPQPSKSELAWTSTANVP